MANTKLIEDFATVLTFRSPNPRTIVDYRTTALPHNHTTALPHNHTTALPTP